MKKQIITTLILGLSLTQTASATEAYEKLGDVGQYLTTGIALLAIATEQDWQGLPMLGESLGSAMLTTTILKRVIKEHRPRDWSSTESFPSGHTTWAFASAGFVHFRYGFLASVPAYTLATLVATSRIQSDAHRPRDVIAGAAIGLAANVVFTRRFVAQDVDVQSSAFSTDESTGLRLSARW